MALTYEWKVTGVRKTDTVNSEGASLEGAVVQTYWEVHGTDENGNKAHFSGATPFSAANTPAGSFVAFEDLTEETVLSWIKAVVENDQPYKEHIDERILYQIGQDAVQDAPMPWAPEDDPLVASVPAESETVELANTDPTDSE